MSNLEEHFDEDDFGPLPNKPPRSHQESWPDLDVLTPKKPGFGFGIAILWCLAYFGVMQVLAAVVFGVPIFVFVALRKGPQNAAALNGNALMQDPDFQLATMIVLVLSHLSGLFFAWLVLRLWAGKQWKRKVALTRLPTFTHMALVLIGFPALIALSVGIEAVIMKVVPSIQDLLDAAGIPFQWPGVEQVLALLKSTPYILGLFAVAVLPAINEEFWCRGFLGHGMAGRYRTWVVVLLTSFLFGCLHMEPRQGLGAMFLGAAIHAAYLATRSLWVAMFVHFANNALAVTHLNDEINFPILKPFEDVFDHAPFLLVASGLVLFMAVCYALYQTRCKLVLNSEEEVSFWQPIGAASAEIPPANVAMKVAHDPISVVSVALVLIGAVQFSLVIAFA